LPNPPGISFAVLQVIEYDFGVADFVCINTVYTQAMAAVGWVYARLRPNPGWAFKALPGPMLPVPAAFTPSTSEKAASRDAEAWALSQGYKLGGAWGCPFLNEEGDSQYNIQDFENVRPS
jgi:hypothetical protein